jgi:hypothetical protein
MRPSPLRFNLGPMKANWEDELGVRGDVAQASTPASSDSVPLPGNQSGAGSTNSGMWTEDFGPPEGVPANCADAITLTTLDFGRRKSGIFLGRDAKRATSKRPLNDSASRDFDHFLNFGAPCKSTTCKPNQSKSNQIKPAWHNLHATFNPGIHVSRFTFHATLPLRPFSNRRKMTQP